MNIIEDREIDLILLGGTEVKACLLCRFIGLRNRAVGKVHSLPATGPGTQIVLWIQSQK